VQREAERINVAADGDFPAGFLLGGQAGGRAAEDVGERDFLSENRLAEVRDEDLAPQLNRSVRLQGSGDDYNATQC